MIVSYVAAALAAMAGVGIMFIGVRYLTAPVASAAGFGFSSQPGADVSAWLNIKGIRDVVSGLVVFALLATGQLHMVGLFVLVAALIPLGDCLTVLRYGGSRALAYGMHGGTALAMVIIGALLQLS
jgi:Domain of unknown function (DUF4267)